MVPIVWERESDGKAGKSTKINVTDGEIRFQFLGRSEDAAGNAQLQMARRVLVILAGRRLAHSKSITKLSPGFYLAYTYKWKEKIKYLNLFFQT
ncbi:hypothetical protein AVEN_198624-1 [Araneus ventricosus]|uniref:Uncharacterized protein n=1 Tax=Araneus ventricosus TaxID=182803 RepID=A0A4Y2HYH7_ARAVE|nr:hypothetical protein AVEN_198624-1 [Araneus ventricosus]